MVKPDKMHGYKEYLADSKELRETMNKSLNKVEHSMEFWVRASEGDPKFFGKLNKFNGVTLKAITETVMELKINEHAKLNFLRDIIKKREEIVQNINKIRLISGEEEYNE